MPLGLAVAAIALAAAQAPSPSVPFVGCRSDGQTGPQPAPKHGVVPAIDSARAERRLAYYSAGELGVLAPRGWHCAAVSGSSGARLLVTPSRADAEALLHFRSDERPRPRYGVELAISYGGTSGRFTVARLIARLFPHRIAFAEAVEREWMESEALPRGAFPADRVERLGPDAMAVTTPAGAHGLAREGSMFASDAQVKALVMLRGGEYPDAVQLYSALPADAADLGEIIAARIRTVWREAGHGREQ